MFENHRKSLIQHCERTKVYQKCPNGPFWRVFENLKLAVKQLPDRSFLIGQKLVENAKIKKKFKCDILGDFQSLCTR